MIYGSPIRGAEEVRIRACNRDEAARIIGARLHELCDELYFHPGDHRPVAGKTYLVWINR